MPWIRSHNGNRLPDDMQPERLPAEPEPDPLPEDEVLLTDSPHSPPGYQRTLDPPEQISYGRGPELRWSHRKTFYG